MKLPIGRQLRLALAATCLVVAGCKCPAPAPPPPDAGPPPRGPVLAVRTGDLELGIGKETFEPLEDGASVKLLEHPLARCCHIFISVRGAELGQKPVAVRVGFYRPSDGAELLVNSYLIAPVRQGERDEVRGLHGFLPPAPGDEVDVRVDLIDEKNKLRSDHRRIKLLPK